MQGEIIRGRASQGWGQRTTLREASELLPLRLPGGRAAAWETSTHSVTLAVVLTGLLWGEGHSLRKWGFVCSMGWGQVRSCENTVCCLELWFLEETGVEAQVQEERLYPS